MEVVIILGNIGEDAQPVWYLQSNHILCIQQGWDPQLLLCHSKCLKKGKKNKIERSCPCRAAELLLIISKKVHCKQPHSNTYSTGEQLHQFNSYIGGTNGVMASSHCLEKSRQEAKNLAWQAGHSSLHSNSPGLPLLFLQPGCVCECTAAERQAWQKGMCQSSLADSFPGSRPNLERSPINGGLQAAFISECWANVKASCLLLPALLQLKMGNLGLQEGPCSPRP